MLLRFMRPRPREPWRQSSVTRRRLRPDPFSLLKAALPLILTFVACLAPVTHAAATAAWSPPRFPAQPTEVVIIGTRHSAQLEYEDHAPARIRALLNRIDPAAVGIETTPAWFAEELYFEIAYESYGVAVPWAREKGKEARAIDWQAGTLEFVSALSWPNTGELRDVAEERLPLDQWDMRELLFADAPEWRDAVHREYAFAAPDRNPWNEATRRYMLYRNLMIAREIANLAADYDGQRIAVLIGAAHKPDLDLFLGTVPNIVIRHASEWWGEGLTQEEVAAEERRLDHLAILWYNLASGRVLPAVADLARMDALLSNLEAEGVFDPEVQFLRAQWHAATGDVEEAFKLFRFLAWEAQWEDRPFTYPDRGLNRRMIEWNAREAESLGFPAQWEPGLGNVISPVGNLTIRQRVLLELAQQALDDEARRRARTELESEDFNARQREELYRLLEAQ